MSGPYRILYVENGIGYGGATICLRHLVRNLDRSTYIPMVVTSLNDQEFREIASDAPWKYIPDKLINVSKMRRAMDRSRWSKHIPVLRFFINQLISRVDDFCNFLPFFIRFLLLSICFRPALIHANNEPMSNRAAILVGKLLRIPVISHVRGPMNNAALTKWLYRLPDHFIPVSHWISKGIGLLGIPASRRTVVYDGIELEHLNLDTDGSAFRKRFGIPKEAYAVGLVGLLIPWKGQHLFISAARKLADEIPGIQLLIIGGTPEACIPYEKELRQRVQEENLEATIIFTGHISEMTVVYNALDVVVSASTEPEPLGTVVIECMAMARPLVAPNHGGAAEMADNEINALLFYPGSAESLAEAIRRFYYNPDLRLKLGVAAREKALKTFAVSSHVAGVQAVYERLFKDKKL